MSPHTRANILLVDDVHQNLVALEAILAPLNCSLVRASSGAEALKCLLERDFALILLDVQMPGIDGFETAEYIKRRERTKHIPIIFLTAIDKGSDKVHRGYSTGAVDYLFKPYDPDTLRSKVAVFVELDEMARALRESEDRARQIVDTAHEAFVAMDGSGRVTDWNPRAQALFGWSKHEAIGQDLATLLIPPEQREAHRAGLERFLATGEAPLLRRRVELEGVHRDGRRLPLELTIAPMATRDGWAFNAFMHDNSERKHFEDDLARARDAALDASRMKSQFLANMSHEIRTPMNGVIGMTDFLLDTDLSDAQLGFATTVRSSAEALLTIIEDILDFSKIEAGKLELDPRAFDVRETVGDVCDLLAAPARNKDLELAALVDDEVPDLVVADQGRLRQILTNLVGNAVKFTREGKVVVAVTTRKGGEAEPSGLLFEVRDTGIGMQADTLERVFESFSQADPSTTRRFGGTGLGLAIARQLAELMGGEMWAENRHGGGSTFSFTIRFDTAAPAPEPPASRPHLAGRRVLVVEDHDLHRTALKQHLQTFGAASESVEHIDDVLETLRAATNAGAPFDLVLLDCDLPGMDSIGERVRADPVIAATTLMLLTPPGKKDAPRKASGFAGCVTKPIRRAELRKVLVRALAQPPGSAPASIATVVAAVETKAAAADGSARLVLVAEDNQINQRVAVGLLNKCGFQVEVAANGREAVEMYARGGYAAVFMDCQMPELDGYEATAEIRRLEAADRRIPIVAMTANTMTGDRERCLAAGMDDYIGKPIRRESLAGVIERVLGGGDREQTEGLTTDWAQQE